MPAEIVLNITGNSAEAFNALGAAVRGSKEAMDTFRASMEAAGHSVKDLNDKSARELAFSMQVSIAKDAETKATVGLTTAKTAQAKVTTSATNELAKYGETSNGVTTRLTDQAAKVLLAERAWMRLTEAERHAANAATMAANAFKVQSEAQLKGTSISANAASWMKKNHENAAHYAAMLDRLTGLHTGLANVLMTGFIPSLLAIGVAISVVSVAVKSMQKEQEELNETIKAFGKAALDASKDLNALKDAHIPLNENQKEILRVGREVAALEWHEKWEKSGKNLDLATKQLDLSHKSLFSLIFGMTTQIEAPLERWRVAYWKITGQSDEIVERARLMKLANEDLLQQETKRKATLDLGEKLLEIHEKSAKAVEKEITPWDRYNVALAEYEAIAKKAGGTTEQLNAAIAGLRLIRDAEIHNLKETKEKHSGSLNEKRIAHQRYVEFMLKDDAEGSSKLIAQANATYSKDIAMLDEMIKKKQINLGQYRDGLLKAEQDLADKMASIQQKAMADMAKDIDRGLKERQNARDELQGFIDDMLVKEKTGKAKIEEMWRQHLAKIAAMKANPANDPKKIAEAELAVERWKIAQLDKLDEAALKKDLARDKKRVASYRSGVMSMVNAVGQGQSKIGNIMNTAFQIFEELENLKTMMVTVQEAKKQTTVAAGLVSGVTSKAAESTAKIGMDGATAATGSYSAMASIPYVGPMLGIAAALAALIYGQQQASKAKEAASSFSGQAHEGMRVPQSGSYLMNLEKGESILPNNNGLMDISSSINSLDNSLKRSGGGGERPINITFAGTVVGDQQAAVKLAKMVKRAMRYGNV